MVTRSRVGTSEHRQEAKSGECREEGKRDERPKGEPPRVRRRLSYMTPAPMAGVV